MILGIGFMLEFWLGKENDDLLVYTIYGGVVLHMIGDFSSCEIERSVLLVRMFVHYCLFLSTGHYDWNPSDTEYVMLTAIN